MGGSTKRMSMDEKRKAILVIYHSNQSVYTEKEILALAAKAGVNASTYVTIRKDAECMSGTRNLESLTNTNLLLSTMGLTFFLLLTVLLSFGRMYIHRVGDIHTGLVDDGLVDKEKIGGSNYFWSFPSKADRQAQLEHERVLVELEQLKQELEQAEQALASAKRGREEEEDEEEDEQQVEDITTNQENQSAAPQDPPEETTPTNSDTTKPMDKNDNAKSDDIPIPRRRSHKLARLSSLTLERTALETELASLKENDPQALADLQHELNLVIQGANRWTDNIYNCQTYLVKNEA